MTGAAIAAGCAAAARVTSGDAGSGGPLGVVIAPNPCIGHFNSGTGGVVTEHAFANVSGGIGPFRYQWQYVSGFNQYGMTDATQREVWWSQAGSFFNTSVFKVTVTDSQDHTAQATVTVLFNPP